MTEHRSYVCVRDASHSNYDLTMFIMEEVTDALSCACIYQQLRQLETDLQICEGRLKQSEEYNDDLIHKLEEESLRREIVEANLAQHKDALIEKARELHERDQTIETQNALLGFLSGQIEEFTSSKSQDGTDGNVNKKRRFSP
jgi:chromosome segregation ATPase